MKRKQSGHLRLLSLLLAAVLLSGCGERESDDPSLLTSRETQPSTEMTEPSTQPTQDPEPTQPVEPPPSLAPVTKLSSIRWRTFPELLSLGDGRILASRNYYDGESAIVNSLDILDVYDDTVVAQTVNPSTRELIDQRFHDGCFVLADPASCTFYVYDGSLQVVDTFTAPNVDGYFSYDRKSYYYINNDVLYRMDVETGNRGRMTLEKDLRLESLTGVHPDRDVLVARVYLSAYDRNCGLCVIDAQTGEFLLLSDSFYHVWFHDDTFYAAQTNDTVYGYDLYYGSLRGGTVSRIDAGALGGDTVNYGMLSGSDFLVRREYVEKDSYTTVFNLGSGGVSCALGQYDYELATSIPVYMEAEQLIFGVYADGYDFSPVVIDPKVLTYEASLTVDTEEGKTLVDMSLAERYLAEVRGPELSDSLTDLRTRADELEREYGVTILLGEQTAGYCGGYARAESDPGKIRSALDTLDEALSLYPKGFLSQLRNGIREGGLWFCLTGELQGQLEPVGMAKLNGSRYILALDITDDALKQTIHHEIWHAIEMRVSTDTFDTPQWAACNPSGFEYYGKYDVGHEKLTKWTYASGADPCYFVDGYARINGREDRARIMEYVMSTDASELMQSAALRQKLELMSQAIRKYFKTDGWTDVYWERYL